MIKRPHPNVKLLATLRRLGVSQIELAHTAGIDPSLLSKVVNGWRKLRPEGQRRIAKVLDVHVKEIF